MKEDIDVLSDGATAADREVEDASKWHHSQTIAAADPDLDPITCSVQVGTGAMAPPGAEKATPVWPSAVGPRELQVYLGVGIV